MVSRALKVVMGFVVVVLIVLAVVSFFGYRWMRGALPKTKGEIVLPGLRADVRVYRDTYGVPHIYAEGEHDLFYAAGFVIAQDRLWQLDMIRRAGAGRLSEIFGEPAVESDRFLRTIGFRRIARRMVGAMHADARDAAEAYVSGINAFIEEFGRKPPIEFKLLRYTPEPWSVEDVIACGRMMAWQLNVSWRTDLVFARIADRLGEEKARELRSGYPPDAPSIMPGEFEGASARIERFLRSGEAALAFLGAGHPGSGSNSWVVSGERSVTGRPILANDPHLELSSPSRWYEMHLVGGRYDVAGATLPGVPGVLLGGNKQIVWGATNAMIDDTDYYIENLDIDRYLRDGVWKTVEVVQETIRVKEKEPVPLEIRLTDYGPMVSGLPGFEAGDRALSMRWTGYGESDELHALLAMNRAGSWEDFSDALREFKVPGQNFVYADVEGNIGYRCAAAVPIRDREDAILPGPGSDGARAWRGTIPFDELPYRYNPPEGFLATANNRIAGDAYPYYLSDLWEPPSRIERIRELLEEKRPLSVQDFKRIQNDVLSPHARTTVPHLLRAWGEEDTLGAVSRARTYLKEWNFEEDAESVGPSIFHAFYLALVRNIYEDELAEKLYADFIGTPNVAIWATMRLLEDGTSEWFDDVGTEKRESAGDLLRKSLRDALADLTERLGEDMETWTWGRLHSVAFVHFLGAQGPLSKVLTVGPFPVGGSGATVNAATYSFLAPYQVVTGPSRRFIANLSDIENVLTVIPTGQSGHPSGPHYKDQTDMWLKGEYRILTTNRKKIENAEWDLLTLTSVRE